MSPILVNENEHRGTYAVLWNASGMAGGVYVDRLEVGSVVQPGKMLLLKLTGAGINTDFVPFGFPSQTGLLFSPFLH